MGYPRDQSVWRHLFYELAGADEDAFEHDGVETAGVGVAQRGVIAAEQGKTVGQVVLGGMAEGVERAAADDGGRDQVGEIAVPGNLTEADDDLDARQVDDLVGQMNGAVANLLRCGFVAGWGATDDGGDPGVAQPEAIVARGGLGVGGEAERMQDGVQEVARAVAGERTAGAVGAVGAGGESKDEDAGARVAEAGDGTRPVGLVEVGAAAGLANGGAIGAQAGAKLAADDAVTHLLEG